MNVSRYLLLFLLFIFIAGCNSPKSLYKKGTKMEAAQLHEEAAAYYYQAVMKKPEFIEAREALKRSASMVIGDKLSTFFQESQMGNKKEAIDAYLDAERYKETIGYTKIELDIPAQYTEDFKEIKAAYLHELYEKGLVYLDEENYEEAEKTFKEIGRIEPDYKDSQKLKDIAYVEPVYRLGTKAFEELKYRTAYNSFEEVVKVDAEYKDALELRDEALAEGLLTIGLMDFENATRVPNAEKKAKAYVTGVVNDSHDPFLKVVDRSNYHQIMKEQKVNLSGAVDESTAAEAGQLLGVKYLLDGTLIELTSRKGKLIKEKKTGFESYKVKLTNDEGEEYTETRYRRTVYYEYFQENSVLVSLQMKLTSLSSGELVVSEILTKTVKDDIHYVDYKGNANKLYPSKEGQPYTKSSARRELKGLVNGRKTLKTTEELTQQAFETISKELLRELEDFSHATVK